MSPKPSATTDPPAAGLRPARWLLPAAASAVAVWFAFLVTLAVLTANPVTIDREQLLSSDAVVVAEPTGISADGVDLRVVERLAGRDVPDTLRVETDEPRRFSVAGRFVVPLLRTREGYAVTPAPPELRNAQVVYPATDDALRAAKEVLATGTPDPYR